MHLRIFTCFLVFLFSCSSGNNPITNKEIDKFISKYNEVKFDQVKDISITQRSRGTSEVVYVVGKAEGNLPVYFVTFDLKKKEIVGIDKTSLEKTKVQDYLTRDEIFNAVNIIREFDFYSFAVDRLQNVYINPFHADEPPYFLRLKTFTGDSIIKRGYVYELYKNRWYLNRTRRR